MKMKSSLFKNDCVPNFKLQMSRGQTTKSQKKYKVLRKVDVVIFFMRKLF